MWSTDQLAGVDAEVLAVAERHLAGLDGADVALRLLQQALAAGLETNGVPVLTGGTDVHLVLVDLTPSGLDGKTAEARLEEVGITINRNAIPFDERPPMNPSGLRIGTPALTTRGLVEEDLTEIAAVIAAALGDDFEAEKGALAERTSKLRARELQRR